MVKSVGRPSTHQGGFTDYTFIKMSSSLGGVMVVCMVGKGVRGKVLIIVVDKYQNCTIL